MPHHGVDTREWNQIIDFLVLKSFIVTQVYLKFRGDQKSVMSLSLLLIQLHLGWHVKTRVKYGNEI